MDLISTTGGQCPSDYELVDGKFFGTLTYCKRLLFGNSIGACGKKKTGTTVNGLGEESVSRINDQLLCVKRDTFNNYHTL